MPRPKKKGLDYFPLDADIFEDDKLFDLQNEYGPLGEVIYLRLLCLVYKNGYYYRFDSREKLAAMVIKSIGNRWARDKKTVIDVIDYLAEIKLFSSELMQRNVLTSRSIQERYQAATGRRQSNIEEYSLLENNFFNEGGGAVPENTVSAAQTSVNVTETSVNVSNNNTKESKENKSKVNERKEEETAPADPSALDKLIYDYGKVNVDRYTERVRHWYSEKGRSPADITATVRKWLEQDNVRLIDHSIDKYNIFINRF